MTPGPGREARKLSPGAEAEYATSIQHRDLDGWWRERLTLAPDVKAIAGRGVAAFISGGLDDYISPANLRAYEQFNSDRKRMLFAPHAHGWQIDFLQELQVQWLGPLAEGCRQRRRAGAQGDPVRERRRPLAHRGGLAGPGRTHGDAVPAGRAEPYDRQPERTAP